MTALLPGRAAAVVFLSFAFAYFLSALLRAVPATLAPVMSTTFQLQARELGLLAGVYFLGFAVTQLPMGRWLDRHGPRTVMLALLSLAVLGCLLFARADSYEELLAARMLAGVGLSAGLMAPLTGYRRWFDPGVQLRANSWMLMTGSMGMLASTLPVQWLLPQVGWRAIFVGLAVLMTLAMLVLARKVPPWPTPAASATDRGESLWLSYRPVMSHPAFRRLVPLGFLAYGGLVSVQTLWAGPWMVRVAGFTPQESATGLFVINLGMLLAFWCWGLIMPALSRKGLTAEALIARLLPLHFVALFAMVASGSMLGAWTGVAWMVCCVTCTCVSLAQPAIGLVFGAHQAGRALSAFNLVIFAGVFVVQWAIGLINDGFLALGWTEATALRAAFAILLAATMLAYGHFLWARPHNRTP